jgi:alpha-beta hydrolase superfamily lysophospholipase
MPIATRYDGPVHLRTRGTILVVPGRGESQATYARLATRLAADSYEVRVLPPPAIEDGDIDDSVNRFAAVVAREIEDDATRPLVLIGADTGALVVAALLAAGPDPAVVPEAVVLAGIPGPGAQPVGDWDQELDARSHCTAHRGVLTDDLQVQRGALSAAVPSGLIELAHRDRSSAPHLVLLGDDDVLTDREGVTQFVKSLPSAQQAVIAGARHDVLNDLAHRSVAATIVEFLERLRSSDTLEPIVRVEHSSW